MVFSGNVPEKYIELARLGQPATITTISGAKLEGKVSFIASVADQATRSFPVEIEIPNGDGKLLAGISATAIVNIGTAPAQLLPQSVLTLDDEGVLGVRTVEDGKVAFHEINIVKDTREGVWVTGLPLTLDVITIGQDFVQAGQTVTASQADGA
jgi:membrane fusion protein, multidrug efflux system